MGLREVPQEGESEVGATGLPRFLCGISFLFTKEIQVKRKEAEELKNGLVAGRSAL